MIRYFDSRLGTRPPLGRAIAFIAAALWQWCPAHAAELSVESEVDATPSELRLLSDRAKSLEAKIGELEKRIADAQKTIFGSTETAVIDYRLELKPQVPSAGVGQSAKPLIVSHVRLSMDGRPFVYTQSAVVVSEKFPLPLFIGKISEGPHQIRLQYQVAPFSEELMTSSQRGWRTVDQVLNLEIVAAAGKQQVQPIRISEDIALLSPLRETENAPDSQPRVIEKMREER
jgi:hypothetical protein